MVVLCNCHPIFGLVLVFPGNGALLALLAKNNGANSDVFVVLSMLSNGIGVFLYSLLFSLLATLVLSFMAQTLPVKPVITAASFLPLISGLCVKIWPLAAANRLEPAFPAMKPRKWFWFLFAFLIIGFYALGGLMYFIIVENQILSMYFYKLAADIAAFYRRKGTAKLLKSSFATPPFS